MIDASNLIWIIPLAGSLGAFVMGLVMATKAVKTESEDDDNDE